MALFHVLDGEHCAIGQKTELHAVTVADTAQREVLCARSPQELDWRILTHRCPAANLPAAVVRGRNESGFVLSATRGWFSHLDVVAAVLCHLLPRSNHGTQ